MKSFKLTNPREGVRGGRIAVGDYNGIALLVVDFTIDPDTGEPFLGIVNSRTHGGCANLKGAKISYTRRYQSTKAGWPVPVWEEEEKRNG